MKSTYLLILCAACSVDHSGLRASDGSVSDTGMQTSDTLIRDIGVARDTTTPDSNTPDSNTPDSNTDSSILDVGSDTPVVPIDAGCPLGERECSTERPGVLRTCNEFGWQEVTCDFECRSEVPGSHACFDLAPSNLSVPLADATGVDAIVNGGRWDTDVCDTLDAFWYVESVPGEVELCVVAYGNVTFRNTLQVVGSRSLVIVATGSITLEGEILADAEGATPGPGGAQGTESAFSGDDGGSARVDGEFFTSEGGGGGGGAIGRGGDGGYGGGSGGSDRAAGGDGGAAYAREYRLIPLRGGGAGGGGGAVDTTATRGAGGGGGGVVQLSARFDILVRGRINVSGGAGQGGRTSNNFGAGGGGGAGGNVHFEAGRIVRFETNAEVLAGGAGGGGGSGCTNAGPGGEEEDRFVSGGLPGANCPSFGFFGARGGDGSLQSRGIAGTSNGITGGNGGGGGGAGGCIVTRATSSMGVLAGSGERRNAEPNIVAVD